MERPGLDVQYGGVGGFIAKKPPKRVDPMKIIQVNEHSEEYGKHLVAQAKTLTLLIQRIIWINANCVCGISFGILTKMVPCMFLWQTSGRQCR